AGSVDYQELDTTAADATHVQAETTHFSIFVACAKKHHKDVDLGVAVVPDLAVKVPDAPDFSVALDFSVAPDFSVPLDFAPLPDLTEIDAGPCLPSFSGNQSNCTFSATCGGHNYQLQCVNFSLCTCYTDGVMGASSGNMGGTCNSGMTVDGPPA